MHLEFTCFYFVLIHLEFKRYLHSYTPIVPTKTIPDSRPTGQSVYPFSGEKAQNPSLWGRHIPVYMAYLREYPPGDVTPMKD